MTPSAVVICPSSIELVRNLIIGIWGKGGIRCEYMLDVVYVFKRLFIGCLCESQAQTTLTLTTF